MTSIQPFISFSLLLAVPLPITLQKNQSTETVCDISKTLFTNKVVY